MAFEVAEKCQLVCNRDLMLKDAKGPRGVEWHVVVEVRKVAGVAVHFVSELWAFSTRRTEKGYVANSVTAPARNQSFDGENAPPISHLAPVCPDRLGSDTPHSADEDRPQPRHHCAQHTVAGARHPQGVPKDDSIRGGRRCRLRHYDGRRVPVAAFNGTAVHRV